MYITVIRIPFLNGRTLTAMLVANSSTALIILLEKGDVAIDKKTTLGLSQLAIAEGRQLAGNDMSAFMRAGMFS